jgi:hypothetical protein
MHLYIGWKGTILLSIYWVVYLISKIGVIGKITHCKLLITFGVFEENMSSFKYTLI